MPLFETNFCFITTHRRFNVTSFINVSLLVLFKARTVNEGYFLFLIFWITASRKVKLYYQQSLCVIFVTKVCANSLRLIWSLYALIKMWKCTCAKYHFVCFQMPRFIMMLPLSILSCHIFPFSFKCKITQLFLCKVYGGGEIK